MKLIKSAMLGLCLLSSHSLMAAWQLDNKDSHLSFVSIKKDAIAETHYFHQMHGFIADNGSAKVSLDLTSVETNIPIRNERMKQHLFNTNSFSSATIASKFDPTLLTSLKTGQSTIADVTFTLNLHGQQQDIQSRVRITKLQDSLFVSSMSPVLIYASQFNLVQGIQTLRDLAKLPNIATAVPVSFNLAFSAK